MAEIAQFLRMGLKCEAVVASASLGGKGLMVERIRAKQSATFLFGAQARAGVSPAENHQKKRSVFDEEFLTFSGKTSNMLLRTFLI